MARLNTTVPDEMKTWLDNQDDINVSGLLQKSVREEMRRRSMFNASTSNTTIDIETGTNFTCECGKNLYQAQSDTSVKCERCGRTYKLSSKL